MSTNIEDKVMLKPFDACTHLEVIELAGEAGRLRAENTRLAAEVERLKQELDEALLTHQTDTGAESVVATLQARIDELEAERDATIAQQAEEIRVLKEEDTKCHLLKDSTINKQAEEIERLKNVISLSEDSRLMDEYIKLERANARQAERIAELEAENGVLRTKYEAFSDEQHTIAAQSAVIEQAKTAIDEVKSLIEESRGVYGLHLNGDESPWSELKQGGRFERLGALPDALAAINSLPEVTEKKASE